LRRFEKPKNLGQYQAGAPQKTSVGRREYMITKKGEILINKDGDISVTDFILENTECASLELLAYAKECIDKAIIKETEKIMGA